MSVKTKAVIYIIANELTISIAAVRLLPKKIFLPGEKMNQSLAPFILLLYKLFVHPAGTRKMDIFLRVSGVWGFFLPGEVFSVAKAGIRRLAIAPRMHEKFNSFTYMKAFSKKYYKWARLESIGSPETA